MARGTRHAIWITMVLLTTMAMIGGCGVVGRQQSAVPTATQMLAPTPTDAPTETPSPTAEPTVTVVPATATPASTELDPTVAINPTSGPPGTEISVMASGFRAGSAVEVGIGPAASEYAVVDAAETDGNGQVASTITVPEDAEAGERWVVVVSVIGQPVKASSNVFEVTSAPGAPTVVVTPRAGSPGTPVTVRGEGFAPEAMVDIGFGRVDSEYDVLQSAPTDASGTVVTEILVPDFAEPEDIWVFVVTNPESGATAVSSPFDVTDGMAIPTETPTAGGFTSAEIYLIAVDDGGASGQLIGCNDSAVPVEVTFEPTIAPLRAALMQLLGIGTEFYGGSGLYNALYRSDLSIAGLDIVQGTATVDLAGDLVLGGVCDAPRVEAQLEQTALQFSTIQQVQVTVNGVPLEDLLSGQ